MTPFVSFLFLKFFSSPSLELDFFLKKKINHGEKCLRNQASKRFHAIMRKGGISPLLANLCIRAIRAILGSGSSCRTRSGSFIHSRSCRRRSCWCFWTSLLGTKAISINFALMLTRGAVDEAFSVHVLILPTPWALWACYLNAWNCHIDKVIWPSVLLLELHKINRSKLCGPDC